MTKLTQKGAEKIVFKGKIFELVHIPMSNDKKTIIFERARRSPGTRLLITKNNKILLIKEFRYELDTIDFRLPGGKVFDSLEEYNQAKKENKEISVEALKAAKRECEEETGIEPQEIKLLEIAKCGATIEWDLYYFLITKFKEKKQKLGFGEEIELEWKTIEEIKDLCINNKIAETQSVGVLLKYILTQ